MAGKDPAKKLKKWMLETDKKFQGKMFPEEDEPLDQFIHYLIFYTNSSQNAKRAFKALKNEQNFSDWNEVRVATINDIDLALDPQRIEHSAWLAKIIKGLLEAVWQIFNEMSLKKLALEKPARARELLVQIEEKARLNMQEEHAVRRGEQPLQQVVPPWAPTYLLLLLGLESNMPWDPYTEIVVDRELDLFDDSTPRARRPKALRDMCSNDAEAVLLHHLIVEFGKRTNVDKSALSNSRREEKGEDSGRGSSASARQPKAPKVESKAAEAPAREAARSGRQKPVAAEDKAPSSQGKAKSEGKSKPEGKGKSESKAKGEGKSKPKAEGESKARAKASEPKGKASEPKGKASEPKGKASEPTPSKAGGNKKPEKADGSKDKAGGSKSGASRKAR